MNRLILEQIIADCKAYSDKNAPTELLDKWSKELLAFAIADLTLADAVFSKGEQKWNKCQ